MICRVDGALHRGRTVTLDCDLDPATVARAVREGTATADGRTMSITAVSPAPVHRRVGCLRPGTGLRTRTALAEAARARGLTAPQDPAIRAARDRLADLPRPEVDATSDREAVADAGTDRDRLRERVAEARGRVRARREAGADTDTAEATLREAARELSEAETAAVAAREDLERARRGAREARDELADRFRLEDRVANLERRARRALVARVRPAFAAAVRDVPGADPGTDPFAADPVTAGLAVARVAAFDAPVVLACDRFPGVEAASAWLGAPVIRV